MKTIKIFLFLGSINFSFAQTITQETFSSGGGFYIQTNASLQFNMGEVIVEDYKNTNCHLQQGFEQGYYGLVGIDEFEDLKIAISIYPNPTQNFINVALLNFEKTPLKVDLTDMTGKTISSFRIVDLLIIDLSSYSNGVYFLNLFNTQESNYQSFKIIKND